jgi:hypothetical protein
MSTYVFRLDYWQYSIVREVAVTSGVKHVVLPSKVWYLLEKFFIIMASQF